MEDRVGEPLPGCATSLAICHHPLHAGYLDDRGGNSVEIIYRGQEANLHQFWDRVLIQERLPHHSDWQKHIPGLTAHSAANAWNPSELNDWTSESHALVKLASYPPRPGDSG